MEKTLCEVHGTVCMLKTGVRDGPNKGKSFYVCTDREGCDFSEAASVPPSHCLIHEDSMVELQALTYISKHQSYRIFYRCVVGKNEGQKWCGNVPWTRPAKEKRNPAQQQPSCLPPVRNPFKAPDKTDKESEWRNLQSGTVKEKESEEKDSKASQKAKERENHQEKNGESLRVGVDKEEREKNTQDTYRDKQLPPGMKIKKRVSAEEKSSPKANGVDKIAGKMQDKFEENRTDQEKKGKKGDKAISTSNVSALPSETRNQTLNDPHKVSPRQSSTVEASLMKQADTIVKESTSKSPPSSSSPRDSLNKGPLACDQPAHSQSSQTKNQQVTVGDDDDVVLVSVKPGSQKTPASAVQKTLTMFPGFQPVSNINSQQQDPKQLHSLLSAQLSQKKATLSVVNVAALPDKGERLKTQVKELEDALESLSLSAAAEPGISPTLHNSSTQPPHIAAPKFFSFSTFVYLYKDPNPHSLMFPVNQEGQAFYGGRMTDDRLLAVRNATCEAIDHLHKSLESCPDGEIEVPLLAHQKRALAWLLWREAQNPCGGILADDMGLGKTLTMIALILTKKIKAKEGDEKKEQKKVEKWLSKTDSSVVVSKGTLIICPASLIHHWKMEIEKHVKTGKLSVYLYHGPNREKSAELLADYDVVVTTYSLVSKEIPVEKEEPLRSAPLLQVAWARVVLDEAHNIKNPKVQTSIAVCQLRARARWAVTGTPIQNNLLDMYSLLKFLRCSPFDEYKLWKAQVDNGSNRGRERLNILTRSLLLRRTKDQKDSTGKPLVSLPDRSCTVHQLKLSADEKAVYDVVFAQSRSTLQNYLKKREGKDMNNTNTSSPNPFSKVAQEFNISRSDSAVPSPQQTSSTVHILSLLLRLRQCCCHLSLLKKTLDSSELQADGIVLSLEEQLNALSLSSSPSPSGPDPKDTVALNGNRFPSQLFEETSESTKALIRSVLPVQNIVIVSQWTSMLHIIAVHLRKMGLRYGVIDGTVNPKRRMDLVEEFNRDPKGPQVMLVSLCAGGVGLNLTGGNHLFLIDMHWNPALEDQACDRIYRVGQKKDVTIHRFVCEETVEEKISALQGKKKELAQNVLSGTGSTFTKLSLADLRIIFGV
uniref:Transcription termination factor 2 n=1 Tax=Echeneis naucrates TaxID=173247 RepID=A0A665V1T7_ECHNA